MKEEERATAWICDRSLLFPPDVYVALWHPQVLTEVSRWLAVLCYLPKLTITPRSVSDNPDKPAQAEWVAMAKVVHRAEFIGLMIFSPGFGFASLSVSVSESVSLLRHPHAAQAKSRTQRSWIIFSHLHARVSETRVWPLRESLSQWEVGISSGADSKFQRCRFDLLHSFFLFSAGSNIPTSFPWKISLRANHTATLSCNCEYWCVGSAWSFFPFVPMLSVSHTLRVTCR